MAKCAKCKWAVWADQDVGDCEPKNHRLSAAMEPVDIKLGNILHGRVNPPKGWEAPRQFMYRSVPLTVAQDKYCDAYESKS